MSGSSWSRRDHKRASKYSSLSIVTQNVSNVTAGRETSTGKPKENQPLSYTKRREAALRACQHNNDVTCWQATLQESDEEESYHNMVIHFHACEPDDGKHGGVALMLSKKANAAWIRGGRKEIRSGKVGKAARYLGMELHTVSLGSTTLGPWIYRPGWWKPEMLIGGEQGWRTSWASNQVLSSHFITRKTILVDYFYYRFHRRLDVRVLALPYRDNFTPLRNFGRETQANWRNETSE